MDRNEKVKEVITWTFRGLLLVAIIYTIYKGRWLHLTLSIITLLLTFLPSIFERQYKIDLPSEFEVLVLFFIIGSIYLGEVQDFYTMFPWWDLFLHTISGLIFAFLAFSLVLILNEEKSLELSPAFVALFAFSFALASGTIWEIFEFSMDRYVIKGAGGVIMQKSGLVDTMWDLIVDTLGALIVSILGWLYIKGEVRLFKHWETRFKRNNPHFFKKSKKK